MWQTWMALWLLLQGMCSLASGSAHYSQCLQDSLQNQTLQLRPCDPTFDLQRWAWEDGRFLVNEGSGRCLSGSRATTVFTAPCGRSSVFRWRCHGDRLMGQGGSLELWRDGNILLLSPSRGSPKQGSTGYRDACKAKLRSGRASGDPEAEQTDGAAKDHQGAAVRGMPEEQKAFLKWYYRTEDPSSWKYAMLALSFGALLLGSVLLVISTMANRSRKKLAQYKAAALAVQMDELQGLTGVTQACSIPPQAQTPTQAETSNDTQVSHVSQTTQVSQPNGKTQNDTQATQDNVPPHIIEPPQESELVQINVPPQESEPVQINVPPQESEPVQINVPPQESEPVQINLPPQESEPVQINLPPQESEPPQDSEPPQVSEPPQDDETPQLSAPLQESEPIQISQPPQACEPLQIEPPQESEPLQISEPPQGSEPLQISEPPQECEPPQISEPPQECEPPQNGELPQNSDPLQESKPLHISEPLESQPVCESPPGSGQTQESTPSDAISQETDGIGS